jgi:hypothetical protein
MPAGNVAFEARRKPGFVFCPLVPLYEACVRRMIARMNSFVHSSACAALLAFAAGPALAQESPAPAPAPISSLFVAPVAPDAALSLASAEVQSVARWVAAAHDNGGLPYLLIDKVNAQVYAFGPDGRLLATAPALLGMTPGDEIKVSNDTQMAQMTANDRVTPAGRFVSRLAIDSHGKELLVLDYEAAISLHAVVKGTPKEHRAVRLASPTAKDNRISFGCINVPATFYSDVVSPTFRRTKGIVYVLPETSAAAPFFGFQPAVDTPASGLQASATAIAAPDGK